MAKCASNCALRPSAPFGPIGKRPVANPELLLQVLSDLAWTLSGRYSIGGDALAELTENVTAVLDVTGAGVSILDEENQLRFVTAVRRDALLAAEEQQEHLQQGPCIDAASSATS